MGELLAAAASAVAAQGVSVAEHDGYLSEIADTCTHFVIVPHEYFAVSPPEPPSLYARTVGFGVEHPGTTTFESSTIAAAKLGGQVEISEQAVAELRSRSRSVTHFQLGYNQAWDCWGGLPVERDIDVVYLGTADRRRCGLLASYAEDLAGLRTELLLPPHEPMVTDRPDFLRGEAKWTLLARSKVILNLHREEKTAFEWVRGLEAMINGCVVVTEPSTDFGPLVPGEHLLVAPAERLATLARAVINAEDQRAGIAERAYNLVVTSLSMAASARRLVELARTLPTSGPPSRSEVARARRAATAPPPMAVWIPTSGAMPVAGPRTEARLGRQLALLRTLADQKMPERHGHLASVPAQVDVLCVDAPSDGSMGATRRSVADAAAEGDGVSIGLRVASVSAAGEPLSAIEADYLTHLRTNLPLGRGRLRNLLMSDSDAEFVLVLDAGDCLLSGALARLLARMALEPDLDVVYCMATHGSQELENALIPEVRRLRERPYLTRGYLARRRWLQALGGFSENPYLEDYLDHDFWLRTMLQGGRVALERGIGIRLHRRHQLPTVTDFDAVSVRRAIDEIGMSNHSL
jgi:hypothetical protein